ncbi:MAG: phosphodiesterase, family [Verrucomicrobia bacterium]|nr:phosphodiesterase, family [Verrucomicrobiota bacterium]
MFGMQKPLSNGQRVVQFRGMRIAVISDTHDRYPPSLPERLRAADEVWHLGDVCAPVVLEAFLGLGKPLLVVRGNCDENDAWPASLTVEREAVRFFLIHIPPARAPSGCDALLHGHTHAARDEMIGGVRWLNPGSLTRPREGRASFAWLTVADGKLTSWQVVRV